MTTRALLVAAGVAASAYGMVLLLDRPTGDVVETALWLVAGVLVHDAVIAPLVIVAGVAGARWLPDRLRPPLAFVLVVLGSVTLMAVPVLGRFGARPDNPTLLDRDYTAGWLVVAGLTLAAAVVLALRDRRGSRGRTDRPRNEE